MPTTSTRFAAFVALVLLLASASPSYAAPDPPDAPLLPGPPPGSPLPRSPLSYHLTLALEGENLSCPAVAVVMGDSPDYRNPPPDAYSLTAFSADGHALYSLRFGLAPDLRGAPPGEWFDAEGNQVRFGEGADSGVSGGPASGRTVRSLFAPYHPDAVRLDLYSPDGIRRLSVDVSGHSGLDLAQVGVPGRPASPLAIAGLGVSVLGIALGAVLAARHAMSLRPGAAKRALKKENGFRARAPPKRR